MKRLIFDFLDHPCKLTCSGWKQGKERGETDLLLDIRRQLRNFHKCPNAEGKYIWKGKVEMAECECDSLELDEGDE